MRRFALVCAALVALLDVVHSQTPASARRQARPAQAAANADALPVRRVVLYKNGVGYFEHLGKVRDNQTISVDFNSSQLDDALKSLTALDLGNGRVTGISYNSEAPLSQRLSGLRLPVGERTNLVELLGALRGARLAVRTGDRVVTGRLLGVERRTVGSGPAQTTRDQITLVGDGGAIRTVDLTPSVSIQLAERESADQVGSYLGLLASTRAPDRRRMTIATAGTGERDLLVSYVSEVPIWKTTYRLVLGPEDAPPLVQGWAIVDNTTGEDWTNVDLSLVAGAPQSFIQQISQPRYGRRPVVSTSQGIITTPQTHDATLTSGGRLSGIVRDGASTTLPGVTVRVLDAQRRTVAQAVTDQRGEYIINGLPAGAYRIEFVLLGFETAVTDAAIGANDSATRNATLRIGALTETVTVTGESALRPAYGGGVSGGTGAAVGRVGPPLPPAPAAAPAPFDPVRVGGRLQDVQAAAAPRELTDLFEYRLSNPISIQRNQSALVPILNARAAGERVSLWNGRLGTQPLRAVWLTNSTGLTLDGGTFTVLDDGAFAGEGLIEPMKPDEKRLLSYAVDLGMQVESRQGDERRLVSRIAVQRGVVTEHREQRARRVYTIRNNDTTGRTLIIEHPTRPGWTLAGGVKPQETSATAYRFAVDVPAKQTTTFVVEEKQPLEDRFDISSLTDDRLTLLVRDSGDSEVMKQALQPILAKKASIAALQSRIADRDLEVQRLREEEQRVRENLQALKDTSEGKRLVRRYADQLSKAEDRIEVIQRERADLERARQQAATELQKIIEDLAVSVEVGSKE